MTEIAIRVHLGATKDTEYTWHPLTDVEGGLELRPRELGPFLRGYLEGWIPDGVITLAE
ncbi:hypothetical protein [Streptomyces sp. NPDC021356]|uniref:hypothetical protein n=1 Tax=Streptomyces sp. NPDC021356 TaxID=3154900 RepID=UPI0033F76CBF